MTKLTPAAKKAFLIGGMCSMSYLAVYIARNILGAVTPQMLEGGSFTTESIGTLSSVYFISYAVGQLINGRIGDRIKAKYMISFGLILAGVCNLLFSVMSHSPMAEYVCYALSGFFLSMIYGPMTKVVAENTESLYTVRCSMGYEFASLLGSPLAGVLAALLLWQFVFAASGAALILMGSLCFFVFSVFEKKGIIQYNQYKAPENRSGSLRLLLQHRIVKFTLISILTGVIRTSVVFWMPTYISQYLSFSSGDAALIFTISSFVISLTTFIAIFIYERLGRNMDLTILLSFCTSALCFLFLFLVKQPVLNIIFLVLAIMASNSAATMLWSRYCPSLRDTGMVSSATGFLDFVSYMAAAASSSLFANAVADIGWGNLILIWFGLMVLGIAVSLPYKKGLKMHM